MKITLVGECCFQFYKSGRVISGSIYRIVEVRIVRQNEFKFCAYCVFWKKNFNIYYLYNYSFHISKL